MRKGIGVLLILLLVILAGCSSPDPDEEPTNTPDTSAVEGEATAPALETVPPRPTETPLPDDYPAPTPYPTATVVEGYPAVPTLPPKYPAGDSDVRVWMLRPLGVQCSDPSTYTFGTLEEAVSALEDAGVEVFESELVSLPVTESCDSPTPEHFRVLINAAALDAALEAGWTPEP